MAFVLFTSNTISAWMPAFAIDDPNRCEIAVKVYKSILLFQG